MDLWYSSFFGSNPHYVQQLRYAQFKSSIFRTYAQDQLTIGGYQSKKHAVMMWGEDFAFVYAENNYNILEEFNKTLNTTYNVEMSLAK